MSKSEPIETAPKDGTEVLGFVPPEMGCDGFWQVVEFLDGRWVISWDYVTVSVTHWMPLPEPPEGEQG